MCKDFEGEVAGLKKTIETLEEEKASLERLVEEKDKVC